VQTHPGVHQGQIGRRANWEEEDAFG